MRSARRVHARFVVCAVCVVSVVSASLGACSFPDVQIDPLLDDVGGAVDGSIDATSDGAADASTLDGGGDVTVADTTGADSIGTDTAGTDSAVDSAVDSATADAKTDAKTDATDGAPTCTTACDCDDDTDKATAAACSGKDCDDYDPRANSKIASFNATDLATATTKGDWNCNGAVEKQYPINVNCTKLAVGGCDGQQGFSGDPACATSGTYVFCKTNLGVTCVLDRSETRAQGCR